jgi:hypothetical protein
MEYETEHNNTRGIATGGLTTGIIGTALGVMNNGGLGNILGGCGCNGNAGYYSRYDAEKDARIANLETEVKLRDANFYSLSEVGKLRDYMEHRFDKVEHELCENRIYNATNTAAVSCLQSQIAQLANLTKTVIPAANICPAPMPQYNSWVAPTAPTTTG